MHYQYDNENLLVGDTVTAGGSGFWTVVNRNSGVLQIVNTWAAHGTRSMLCTPVSGSTCEVVKDDIPECSAMHCLFGVRIPAALTATSVIWQIRRPSALGLGAALAVQVMTSPLRLRLVNAAGAPLFTSATIPNDTPLRVEVIGYRGTTTTNGKARLAYYDLTAPTVALETPYTSDAVNAGIEPFSPVRGGRCSGATADVTPIRFDDFEIFTDADVVGLNVPWVDIVPPPPVDPPEEPPVTPPSVLERQGRRQLSASGLWV